MPLHFATSLAMYGITEIVVFPAFFAFQSQFGLQTRYLGASTAPTLLSSNRRRALTFWALSLGNGTVSLGDTLEAQKNGGFSQNMGMGSVFKGIRRRAYLTLSQFLWAAVAGTFIYVLGIQVMLYFDIFFFDVKLASTLLLLVLLAGASIRHSNREQLF